MKICPRLAASCMILHVLGWSYGTCFWFGLCHSPCAHSAPVKTKIMQHNPSRSARLVSARMPASWEINNRHLNNNIHTAVWRALTCYLLANDAPWAIHVPTIFLPERFTTKWTLLICIACLATLSLVFHTSLCTVGFNNLINLPSVERDVSWTNNSL